MALAKEVTASASSLRSRFSISAGANGARAVLLLGASVALARGLGAESYGRLQFLIGTAVALRHLVDLGSSSAFFTLASGRPYARRIVGVYGAWLLLQLAAVPLLLAAAWPWLSSVWLGEPLWLVLLAFVAVFLQEAAWGMVSSVGEAARQTAVVQAGALLATILYCGAIVAGASTVSVALVALAVSYLAAVGWTSLRLRASLPSSEDGPSLAEQRRFYLGFCSAYGLTTLTGFGVSFADAWLMQRHGGAEQQAYAGISLQLSSAALLATVSFVKVFWKEIAEALSIRDLQRAHELYERSSRLLYLAACTLCALMSALAPEIIHVALGPEYGGAVLPFTLMCLFPLVQTLGQLNNTFLLAGSNVRTYAALSIASALAGLGAAWLLLAVLDLGAVGAPIRQVAVGFLVVNLQRAAIARLYRWKLDWSFQWRYAVAALVPALLLAAAFRAVLPWPGAVIGATAAVYGLGAALFVILRGFPL